MQETASISVKSFQIVLLLLLLQAKSYLFSKCSILYMYSSDHPAIHQSVEFKYGKVLPDNGIL